MKLLRAITLIGTILCVIVFFSFQSGWENLHDGEGRWWFQIGLSLDPWIKYESFGAIEEKGSNRNVEVNLLSWSGLMGALAVGGFLLYRRLKMTSG